VRGWASSGLLAATERVIRGLNQIIEWRGKPFAIRVDNGPEYVSGKVNCRKTRAATPST
jgi:hypothetical protein